MKVILITVLITIVTSKAIALDCGENVFSRPRVRRSFGGRPIVKGEAPHQVFVMNEQSTPVCGGVIFDRWHLLSIKSCFKPEDVSSDRFILAGIDDHQDSKPDDKYEIGTAFPHPNADLIVVRLKRPFRDWVLNGDGGRIHINRPCFPVNKTSPDAHKFRFFGDHTYKDVVALAAPGEVGGGVKPSRMHIVALDIERVEGPHIYTTSTYRDACPGDYGSGLITYGAKNAIAVIGLKLPGPPCTWIGARRKQQEKFGKSVNLSFYWDWILEKTDLSRSNALIEL